MINRKSVFALMDSLIANVKEIANQNAKKRGKFIIQRNRNVIVALVIKLKNQPTYALQFALKIHSLILIKSANVWKGINGKEVLLR